jgi:hypothetical protein
VPPVRGPVALHSNMGAQAAEIVEEFVEMSCHSCNATQAAAANPKHTACDSQRCRLRSPAWRRQYGLQGYTAAVQCMAVAH